MAAGTKPASLEPTSPDPPSVWWMPLDPEAYDRDPKLLEAERDALGVYRSAETISKAKGDGQLKRAERTLARLSKPLADVHALTRKSETSYYAARRVLYSEMLRRDSAFWAWSPADWLESCGSSPSSYTARHSLISNGRHHLLALAYLLGGVRDLRPFGLSQSCVPLARTIFGRARVDEAMARVGGVLFGREGIGYEGAHKHWELRRALCQALLLNQSPSLEALSAPLLEELASSASDADPDYFQRLGRALGLLGLLTWVDPPRPDRGSHRAEEGVPPLWAAWSRAWYDREVHLAPGQHSNVLLALYAVGRWLRDNHPEILTPEQWGEDLALEYVQYLSTSALSGQDASPSARRDLIQRGAFGKPLSPWTISGRLCGHRRAFSDWQDRPHSVEGLPARTIPIRFKPGQAFATPRHIKALIRPNPRDIDLTAWYKLAYAAATLKVEDLRRHGRHFYPPTLYRALALLWVTTARRPNELRRLRLGCVRREWDQTMLDESGEPIEHAPEELCYLQVPVNKTQGAFWIWIPTYTADAIAAALQEGPA
ncbi:MAG: hypothetical protein JRN08_07475 [Nitrososphaerota archaeon]|nr:hypothetical protein [Nitrososphaerota archaeon]